MNLKKIKKTLATNKSSTQITRLCFFLELFLIVSIISSKAVFACGITSATLYIGDTIEQAENHNTSIVYRPVAYENGWHIHWALSPPDDYVKGFIWDTTDDLNRGYVWGAPSDREESGGSSYLPGLSVGPHIIKAKIHKAGSEQWFWSNPRTVVYVAVGKVMAYVEGSWYDADENDRFVVLRGKKYIFKAFPNPSTAIWPIWPNPEPSWQFNGNPLNPSGEPLYAYQSGDYSESELPKHFPDSGYFNNSLTRSATKEREKGDQIKGQYNISCAVYAIHCITDAACDLTPVYVPHAIRELSTISVVYS
jgi:hypothetical protein